MHSFASKLNAFFAPTFLHKSSDVKQARAKSERGFALQELPLESDPSHPDKSKTIPQAEEVYGRERKGQRTNRTRP